MSYEESLRQRLYVIQKDGLTDPNASRFIADIDTAGAVLGPPLSYSQPIESEVHKSGALVTTLLPKLTLIESDFLSLWEWQEDGHAATQANVLEAFGYGLGAEVAKTTMLAKVVGNLSEVSPGFHRAMKVGVFAYMALGEQETIFFYRHQADRALAVDEVGLAETMNHTAKQESRHLGFQTAVVREEYSKLTKVQQRFSASLRRKI